MSPRRPRGFEGNVPVQNCRSEWPRGATSAQEDVPNHLRVRLSFRIAREPDAASRTSDRERDDLASLLTRFDTCREEATVGKIRAREDGVIDRAACLTFRVYMHYGNGKKDEEADQRVGRASQGYCIPSDHEMKDDLRWRG